MTTPTPSPSVRTVSKQLSSDLLPHLIAVGTGKINKIKRILLTIQKVLGKIASFGERIHYIFSWTDRIVTGVALFVAVVFVLLTTVLLNALYSLSLYIGGRPIFFALGCVWLLPPSVSVIPWAKMDKWEEWLLEETETEANIQGRSKAKEKSKPPESAGGADKVAAPVPEAAPDGAEPEPEPEPELEPEPEPEPERESQSRMVGMLENLWARVPDVPVRLRLFRPTTVNRLGC